MNRGASLGERLWFMAPPRGHSCLPRTVPTQEALVLGNYLARWLAEIRAVARVLSNARTTRGTVRTPVLFARES